MRGQIPVREPEEVKEAAPERPAQRPQYKEQKEDLNSPMSEVAKRDTREQQKQEPIKAEKKIGRNDPCPCGSGKKYKHCCGKDQQ